MWLKGSGGVDLVDFVRFVEFDHLCCCHAGRNVVGGHDIVYFSRSRYVLFLTVVICFRSFFQSLKMVLKLDMLFV